MVDDEKVLLLFLSWISIIFLCHNDKSVKRGVSYASSFFYVFNILILDYFQSFAFCEYFKIGSDALTMELLHHLCVLGVLLALKYNHFIVSCLLIVFVSMLYNKTYIYLLVFVVNSLFSKWKSCHGDSNACDGTVRLTACGFIMTLALVVSCYHVEDMPMDNFVRWLAGMVEHMVESIWDYELNIVTIFERMSCNRVGAQWSATPKHYYEPGIGIWWYLHAQVFSSYDCYFQYLLHCQPALYVLPLVARFQPSGWCSQIIAHVMVGIIIYFDPKVSLMSLVLFVTVLMQHEAVFFAVEHISLLSIVVCVCIVLSSAIACLWVDIGQSNANFLFFIGACLWLMLGVGLIEYCSVLSRKSDFKGGK